MKYVREVWECFAIKNASSCNESTWQYKSYWWVSCYGNIKITYNYKDDVKYPLTAETGGHAKEGQRYLAISINDAPEKYLHRLVARYFVENPDPETYTVVHHIDHNKSNNRWDNLMWTTHADNINYYIEYKKELEDNGEV